MNCWKTLAAICLVLSSAASANAQTAITIMNPGFEEDAVSPGCFEVMPLTSWPTYDPNGILNGGGNSVGGLNLPLGSVFYPAGAPQGDHAALVFLLSSIGAGPAGLRQQLSATLQINTVYTLSAQVGNIDSGLGPPPCDVFGVFNLEGFPGYQVQLLAGELIIGQDDNSLAGVIDDGEFGPSVTRVCIGSTHPRESQSLEIRLINLNLAETPENPGVEVNFDDIQLVSEPNLDPLTGDVDYDCDVDLDDYSQVSVCVSGPNQLPSAGCPVGVDADFDQDNDVDLADIALLMLDFGNAM